MPTTTTTTVSSIRNNNNNDQRQRSPTMMKGYVSKVCYSLIAIGAFFNISKNASYFDNNTIDSSSSSLSKKKKASSSSSSSSSSLHPPPPPTSPNKKVVVEFEPLWPLRNTTTSTTTTSVSDNNDLVWKQPLYERLDRIRTICGTLCTNANNETTWYQNSISVKGANLRLTQAKDINCPTLILNEDIDASDTSVRYPPPTELLPYYSIGNSITVNNHHRHVNVYLGKEALQNIWTKELVEEQMKQSKQGILRGSYRVSTSNYVRRRLESLNITGKHILVIGSERPWIEAICLSLGAKHVTTLEYGSIVSKHPQITTLTPSEMRIAYQNGRLELFDVVVSHSSLEHSGLGRYGDALNPWGDLLAVARAWCLTKPNATMYLGVPIGKDSIAYNAHRIYGKIRFSLLATNWIQMDGESDEFTDQDFEQGIKSLSEHGVLFRKVSY